MEKTDKLRQDLDHANSAKRILYTGLKTLAGELKSSKEKCRRLRSVLGEQQRQQSNNGFSITTTTLNDVTIPLNDETPLTLNTTTNINTNNPKFWYEGGMWRPPNLLPSITTTPTQSWPLPPVSLTDLFLDLAIVTALARVGVAIQDRGTVDGPILAYFLVFWSVWGKVTAFTTRFDTTDLTSQMEALMTCLAVLCGSLSTTLGFGSGDATRMMEMGLFVSFMHFLTHCRVWFGYRDGGDSVRFDLEAVKTYAGYIMVMTALESLTWVVGIFFLANDSKWRMWVFFVAILCTLNISRGLLPNDFYAACSKRGVLFILLLGFTLQKIVMVATPFFDYQIPSCNQYIFMGLACFLLFCIKLLYVDDSFSVDPADHALLVNHMAAFFFHVGQLLLLLSTTVLGAGLNLLTHSYLAATTALPANAKNLVCGGFSGVIFSIGFIKSMHLRRVPANTAHRRLFFAAYGTQLFVTVAVVVATASMCLDTDGDFGQMYLTEIQTLCVLCGLALFLLVIYWMDEAVELNIYDELAQARQFRVEPFGLWSCLNNENMDRNLLNKRKSLSMSRKLSQSSLYSGSSVSLTGSGGGSRSGSKMQLYAAIGESAVGSPRSSGDFGGVGGGVGGGFGRSSRTERRVSFKSTSDVDPLSPSSGLIV